MTLHVTRMISEFFSAIEAWDPAYSEARLTFIAARQGEVLEIIAARIYLASVFRNPPKDWCQVGRVEAGQLAITGGITSVKQAIEQIASDEGFLISGRGRLLLRPEENQNISVGPPTILHPEGITQGNRLAVFVMNGIRCELLTPQPQTDWMLKAAHRPYDTLTELKVEYELGSISNTHTVFEVIAKNVAEVSALSNVTDDKATLGLWLAKNLDRSIARLGYRVLDKGVVVNRGSIEGDKMNWEEKSGDIIGEFALDTPLGAVVQCIASYAGHAHHQYFFADPKTLQNSRAAVLFSVDQTGKLLREYLLPDLPPKGKAADDFESAVAWLLWALGFAPASFGINAKTRDTFDLIAVSPRGDFVVVECTLGLLRAESKLSKLGARAASLRKLLTASGLSHIRVLPIIVTAMTKEEVKADLNAAAETGVLVLTRENLENVLNNEQLRFPNADQLYERALQTLAANSATDLMSP